MRRKNLTLHILIIKTKKGKLFLSGVFKYIEVCINFYGIKEVFHANATCRNSDIQE